MKMFLVLILLVFCSTSYAVSLPEHAHQNTYGSGWTCDRGYYKSGNKCVAVVVPKNAGINIYGSGWACNEGFKKNGNSCLPMTSQELQNQLENKNKLAAIMQSRMAQAVSGDDCETEYDTNTEVCVEITGGDLDCNKNYSGNYYSGCDITLSYDVQTDYSGDDYLDVDVECKVELEYKGRQTYSTLSDSSSQSESHSLYAHGDESETMNFSFSFSSYIEITSAKISSAECEINSVYKY